LAVALEYRTLISAESNHFRKAVSKSIALSINTFKIRNTRLKERKKKRPPSYEISSRILSSVLISDNNLHPRFRHQINKG
jgi:hypothetical protein